MASFTKMPNGKWRAAVKVNGQRRTKSGFDSKAQARNWASAEETELGKGGGAVAQDHRRLSELFERYRDEVSSTKKGARWEVVRLTKFCTYPLAKLRLARVEREDIEAWIDERLKSVLSSSVNRELNLMSHCFTQARRWRWMKHNPMADLKRPKDPPPRDRRITPDEVEQMLIALDYRRDGELHLKRQLTGAAFLFAIETAMRIGEVCCLNDERVDFDKRIATLRPGDTKTGAGRKVPLSSEAIRILRQLPPVPAGQPLFDLKSDVGSAEFTAAVKLTPIEDLTFHDSRHEATTRLAGKFEVLDLARITGHRNIKQLMTYYNKSAEDMVGQLD